MKRLLPLIVMATIWIAPSVAQASPVQAHSMLHICCDAPEKIEHTFQVAKRLHMRYVRLDVESHGIIQNDGYDFSRLDLVRSLSQQYRVRVVAILLGTPQPFTGCPEREPAESFRCAPRDPEAYAQALGKIVDRAPNFVWEFWNEPDLPYAYTGTPEQYAGMLSAFYRVVKASHPRTRVVFGGVAGNWTWVQRALRAGAGASFDIASVHMRGPTDTLRKRTMAWRKLFYQETHRKLPFWVTEHGFPHDPRFQRGGYRGDRGQARYLVRSIRAMNRGGARQVFVTLFDAPELGDNEYAFEGIAGKPAARALAALRR